MRQVGCYFHPQFLQHIAGIDHPESPQRLKVIVDHLKKVGLWDLLISKKPEVASIETLSLVHPRSYISLVEQACKQGLTALDPDTYVSQASWGAARLAAGAVVQAVDSVCSKDLDSAFCLIRPPGHHALAERAMGFCLFNNVAIAARFAKSHLGLSRILIIDWDVHHGNGTQAIFYEDPDVLYFSVHQYPFYPGTGSAQETGAAAGLGFNINIELPSGADDAFYIGAFLDSLIPKAATFKPELILISSGFDAHQDDPLAGMQLSTDGYGELTGIVRDFADKHCNGRIVSVLEGGYSLTALGPAVEAHLKVLLK